jgi:hypothetical protein
MRTARSFLALLALPLLAVACDAMGPGPGRPFAEDRQYVLSGDNSTWCTASGLPAGCQQAIEFHADGTAQVPYGNLVLQTQYVVRGSRVEAMPNEPSSVGTLRFDLSSDENTLTERESGRVWRRYELLRHLSRTRALA